MRKEKQILIGNYQDTLKAMIDRDFLIAAGIQAKVIDAASIMNNTFYQDLLGTAKLLVPESQSELAHSILEAKRISSQN